MSITNHNKNTSLLGNREFKLKMHKQMIGHIEKSKLIKKQNEETLESRGISNQKSQNKLAEEIHDTVCQELFGIVCCLHTLSNSWYHMEQAEVTNNLNLITECSREALSKLRSIIYGSSLENKEQENFVGLTSKYLNNISRLNYVLIDFNTNESGKNLQTPVKTSLYRIICEATNNAIYHGRCKSININLFIQKENVYLNILDDGGGFNLDKLNDLGGLGLGINNIRGLVEDLRGSFSIKSEETKGTEINITIPQYK